MTNIRTTRPAQLVSAFQQMQTCLCASHEDVRELNGGERSDSRFGRFTS